MSGPALGTQDQALRLQLYRFWCRRGRPPTVVESAAACKMSQDAVRAAWQRLQQAHQLLLEPDGQGVRMANPLSARPTGYRARVDGRWLHANCAWDALGIPAMLQQDALVEMRAGPGDAAARFDVRDGEVSPLDGLVHFALPFRRWYDDLVET